MYIIKIGEVNNRDVVAYSNNKKFTTASVNYADNITEKYPDAEVIDVESVREKLLNVGV
jgi:hypothetical protein